MSRAATYFSTKAKRAWLAGLLLLAGPCWAADPPSVAPGPGDQAPGACLIEPHQVIKLATPVAALVDKVFADRGAGVTRGMPLAHLSSALEEADVALAQVHANDASAIEQKEARRDFAGAKLARLQRLKATSQYVSPTAYEEADADARQATAELQAAIIQARVSQIDLVRAKAKLEERTIRAPVDGVVTERSLSVGEYAYEQAHILTLAELDPLNVETYLPIASFGSVGVGTHAEIRPELPIGGRYDAIVTVVDRAFDSRSGTFGVRLALPNAGLSLPANIRCTITFTPK